MYLYIRGHDAEVNNLWGQVRNVLRAWVTGNLHSPHYPKFWLHEATVDIPLVGDAPRIQGS